MIKYHVPINPVHAGPYHKFNDSMSSAPEDVGNIPMASFQGVSYQADVSGSLGLPTQGIDVHTDYSSHAVQSQLHTFTPMITHSLIVNPLLFSLKVCILMNMPAYMRKNAIWNAKRAVVKVTQAQQISLQITLTIYYMQLLLNTPLWQIGCMNSLSK